MSDTMQYECPDCGRTMVDIGDGVLQCSDADGCGHEAPKDMFDKALLMDVLRDSKALLLQLDADRFHSGHLNRMDEVLKMAQDEY